MCALSLILIIILSCRFSKPIAHRGYMKLLETLLYKYTWFTEGATGDEFRKSGIHWGRVSRTVRTGSSWEKN